MNFIAKAGHLYNLTENQEAELFMKEYSYHESEFNKFLKQDSLRIMNLDLYQDIPFIKDILLDFWFAGHLDERTKYYLFRALIEASRQKNLFLFEKALYDYTYWIKNGVPLERAKLRC